jgi:general secretion pathway protein D
MAPSGSANGASLIEFITTTVAPSSWDKMGGPGAISEFRGPPFSLVIIQTQDAHEGISALFQQLREAKAKNSHDRP